MTLRVLTIACLALAAAPAALSQEPLVRLEKLPKPHYYWPTYGSWPNDLKCEQIVRITGTASISGEYAKETDARRMMRWAKQHGGTVGINYSIWHREFPKDQPPTTEGPLEVAELRRFIGRLKLVELWTQAEGVEVSAILLDSERFHVRPGDDAWNQALDRKYNLAYDVCKRVFPQAVVEWYGSGWQRSAAPTGWSKSNLFTFREKRDSVSCSLYAVPEIDGMRETYRRTAELGTELKLPRVTPWVALASGYRRQVDQMHAWSDSWDYELIYDWTLGREINVDWFGDRPLRFAPYRRADYVVFYPQPYRNADWEKHFIAYVLGATGKKKLTLDGG